MAGRKKPAAGNLLVLALNLILLTSLIVTFFAYDSRYQEMLYNQNLDEISNINQASANISSTFFSGREAKLRDLALYIEQKGLTLRESMDFIHDTNSDATKSFELIAPDGTGFRVEKDADGNYIPLDYTKGYGSICTIFTNNQQIEDCQIIGFAPEFTDGYTAMKSFALYNSVDIIDDTGESVHYTLMVVSTSSDFIDMININSGYEKLSTTIINKNGDYIIGNSEFKSDNFFSFLSTFNDLTLDETNEVQLQMTETEKGSLAYQDGRGRPSVFVYTPVPDKDWYCVTLVPVANFRNGSTEFSFTLLAVVQMFMLLVVDILFLYRLNRKLRISAENERISGAAKTDFLARMSHDMRTPMNGIIGMTRLTQDIPNLPAEAQENLSAISDSSSYLLQLINDTLDMSKIESNKFTLNQEVVNAKGLLEHIVSTIQPLADQKQIKLEIDFSKADMGYIRADRIRVQQIFLNILSNSVKFTPKHGKISVTVECLKLENGVSYDCISVTDSGCGMSEEFLNHIYEPFSQENTKNARGQEGTGLGMAIVKNLTELMGGRIQIESHVGTGTKVTVFLSFERVDGVSEDANEEDYKEFNNLDGKRILLAEDHPLNATIARRVLEKRGILVDHAEDGAIAVQMFSESAFCYYDFVLMDIRMPNMNGLDAAKAIRMLEREDAKKIPIIAMTANAYAEDIQAAIAAGMNAHLAKPVEPEMLYAELEKYLRTYS